MRQTNRCFFPSLERELNDWIIQARANGIIVTGTRILIQAKLIAEKNGVELFRGSKGWLSNFLARHDYSLRRINSMGKDLPKDISKTIHKFIDTCENKRANFTRAQIYNWDETHVELDSPSSYTYDKKGTTKIHAKTTGQQKTSLSVGFAAAANGDKLAPVFVLPRKRQLKFEPDGCLIVYKGTSKTFDSQVILISLKKLNMIITSI